jgi:hypothetical protein
MNVRELSWGKVDLESRSEPTAIRAVTGLPVRGSIEGSKYAGEIISREAVSVGEMRQQAATGTHSRVGRGHCRSGALNNSKSLSALPSGLGRRGRWKALCASSILIAGIMPGENLRQTANSAGRQRTRRTEQPNVSLRRGTATPHLGSSFVVSS